MTGFSERFIKQGRQEGKLEGKQEDEAMILLRQLQLKFGDVSETVRAGKSSTPTHRHYWCGRSGY